MPCWYYEKKELRHTPSVNQGLSLEDEIMFRREGARFILQLGNKMGLRYETMATGVVYFHRFYMVHTFQEFPRHVTACCCLFLAGKVEETPKKCKDIIKHARTLIDEAENLMEEFGSDPREEVMTLERILLQTIKFDFIVEHPYSYLLKYAKCLKGDKKKLQSMVQMAWTFVNDGLCTTLCLQWEPEIIAIALMYLSGKLNKFEVTDWQGRNPRHQKWWDMYVQGISMELLEDICHQVLDLYSTSSTNAMPAPAIEPVTAVTPAKVNDSTKTVSPASAPPPAKKAKKEEIKVVSPAKVETPVTQPYPYSYAYSAYPPSYPPPAAAPAVATPPARYTYPYPPTTAQHPPPASITPTHPPAHQPTHQPSHPPAHPTPPPAAYQSPATRYPPSGSTSSNTSVPPPHYTTQAPPPGHYPATHPPPYPPPSGGAPLYPPPPTTHSRPPPSHYSHSSSASSYYPPTTPTSSTLPQTYQQPSTSSYSTSSSSYGHTSSRSYYPPST